MATTESSAVVRFIHSVQAQPILATPPPIPDPGIGEDDVAMAPLGHDFETVVVQSPRRRWPWFLFGAIVLLGGATAAGYVLGTRGKGPTPAAGVAPAAPERAQTVPAAAAAPSVAEAPQPAVATTEAVAEQAQAAVAIADSTAPAAEPQVAFDASFDIVVEPAGARVLLDGKELGPAPLRVGRLAPGAHAIEIVPPPGYEGQRVEVDLPSGERQVLRLELDAVAGAEPSVEAADAADDAPAVERSSRKRSRTAARREARSDERSEKPAAPKKSSSGGGVGTLMLGSKPPCQIFVDGRNTGLMTPQRALELKAGKHKITLVNRDHGIQTTATVTIEAGKTQRLIKDMSDRL